MLCYMQRRGVGHIPLIGNVFLLSPAVLSFFRRKSIPGVVISDELMRPLPAARRKADRGAGFFTELAAKQLAIFRGLGFAGGYLGGVHTIESLQAILDLETSFAPDDWKQFAREIHYPGTQDEFYYFAEDPSTGLADASRLNPTYAASLSKRDKSSTTSRSSYRFSKSVHDLVFTPGRRLYVGPARCTRRRATTKQGPALLRILETGQQVGHVRLQGLRRLFVARHRVPLSRIAMCQESAKWPLRRHA